MAGKAKKIARARKVPATAKLTTRKNPVAKSPLAGSPAAVGKKKVARKKVAVPAKSPPNGTREMPRTTAPATELDLIALRDATKSVFVRLRDIDEDTLPADKREEYWRDRHLARTAWEHAENAAFANLVEAQKLKLPVVSASAAKLARDVQTVATILGVLDVVSAALGILASVISLLA